MDDFEEILLSGTEEGIEEFRLRILTNFQKLEKEEDKLFFSLDVFKIKLKPD